MITQENIIKLPITHSLYDMAVKISNISGDNYNKKTIRKNNIGRLVGFIGELSIIKYLYNNSIKYDWQNIDPNKPNFNFDIQINNLKIDIKSKDRTVEPKLDYECSIAGYSRQLCDYYVFTSITRNSQLEYPYHTANILGYIPHDEYYENAKTWKKGDIDTSNGWVVSIDCFNLPIEKLYPISDLIKIIT